MRKFLGAPLDFIARLAALLPKPRVYLTRFHGVFAPNSPHRVTITPAKRGKGASRTAHIEDVEPDERTPMEYLFILPILADDRDLVVIPEVIGKEESFHRDFAVNADRAAT